MRTWPAVLVSLACGAAFASCGRMADSRYQPPHLATLTGTLHATGSPGAAGHGLLALAWQPGGRGRALFVELEQAGPPVSDVTLACSSLQATSTPCDGRPWSGHRLCREEDDLLSGLARTVAFESLFPAAFALPIDDLPPAGARYDLARQGGRGTLALGYLVAFVDEDGDGQIRFGTPERAPEPALANSAFQGYQPEAGSARVSYWVAFLDGELDRSRIAEGYGALGDLPLGFSLWKRTEVVDAAGRSLAVDHSVEPIDTPIELFDYPGIEGLAVWCTERAVEELWLATEPGAGAPFRCTAGPDAVSCERLTTTGPCQQLVERYQTSVACVEPPPPACGAGGWAPVTPMPEPLIQAVLLRSGKVLAFGGYGPTPLAAIFDPETGLWWQTGSMTKSRAYASATVLTSGKVLVAGGGWGDPDIGRTAEIYDPETGLWTPTASLTEDRSGHSATLLPSGKVLVAGGTTPQTQFTGISSAEIFDPATGTWSTTGGMAQGRGDPSAILLRSGLVLVAGAYESQGADPASCELYDPATGTWRATGSRPSSWPIGHYLLLDSGQVLRLEDSWATNIEAGTELFEPSTETWERRAPMPRAKGYFGVALLPSGRVLVAGGFPAIYPYDTPLDEVEIYDPITDHWSAAAPLGTARNSLTTVRLGDGTVLALGGDTVDSLNTTIAELYCEGPGP